MTKIAIIIDSTSIVQPHEDLYIVPLQININNQSYKDQVNIFESDWTAALKQDATMTTSQPAIGDAQAILDIVKQKDYEHLYLISISSHLSGTYNVFNMIAQECDTIPTTLIDSYSTAGLSGYLAETIFKLNQAGYTHQQIMDVINDIIDHTEVLLYPGSLSRLAKSGRLSKGVALIGNFLKLKIGLILRNKGQVVEKYDIYRTNKKMISQFESHLKQFGTPQDTILYLLSTQGCEVYQDFKVVCAGYEIREASIPASLATHVGLGTVGIQMIKKAE